jgi:hypothetical protein
MVWIAIGIVLAIALGAWLWADASTLWNDGGNRSVNVPLGVGTADFVIYGTTPGAGGVAPPSTGGVPSGTKQGGRLCIVTVITEAAGALVIYDSLTASAGSKPLFTVPAAAAAGLIYVVKMPFDNGLVAATTSSTPSVTLSFNTDSVSGRAGVPSV